MNEKKNQTWACDHLKTSNLSADNFKKILDLDGSTPEPAIRSSDTGQRIPCFEQLSIDQNIDVEWMCALSVFLCSQTS